MRCRDTEREAAILRENWKWSGTNRGAYANPAWDEVGQRLRAIVGETKGLEREFVRVFSTAVPALPICYDVDAIPVGHGSRVWPIREIAHTGIVMHTWNARGWNPN